MNEERERELDGQKRVEGGVAADADVVPRLYFAMISIVSID